MEPSSLNGTSLRCCTLIEPPMVFEDPNHDFGFNGVGIEYLENLQRKLNFSCSSLELFRDGNNTGFTDFIFHMQRCTENGRIISNQNCNCDIGASGFIMNPQRLNRVDYLPAFLNDDLRVVTHVDNTAARLGGAFFLTTFSAEVWLAIAALLLIFVLLKLFDSGFQPPVHVDPPPLPPNASAARRLIYFLLKNPFLLRLRKALESTLLRMIGQPPEKVNGDTYSFRQRLLNFVILLCGLFLVLAYEATMTASLVQESVVSDFRTVHDFQNCKIPATDVCMPGGGAVEAFWRQAIARHPCHRESGLQPTFVGSVNELLQRTASKECKFSIGTGSTLMDATNGRYCGVLVLTGEHFLEGGCGFTLPLDSPYTLSMTNATLELRLEGALPTLAEYLQRFGQCSFLIEPTLTFGRLRLFFFLAYGVCAVILFAIVFVPRHVAKKPGATESGIEKTPSTEDEDNMC